MKAKKFKELIAKIPDDAEILVRPYPYRDITPLSKIETDKYWKSLSGSEEYVETRYSTKKDVEENWGQVKKITGIEFD